MHIIQLHASNNRSYILNTSSEDGLVVRVLAVSMDHCNNISGSCYFAKDINNITFAKYFVSMASVSGSRTGPFSDQVESMGEENQSRVTIL